MREGIKTKIKRKMCWIKSKKRKPVGRNDTPKHARTCFLIAKLECFLIIQRVYMYRAHAELGWSFWFDMVYFTITKHQQGFTFYRREQQTMRSRVSFINKVNNFYVDIMYHMWIRLIGLVQQEVKPTTGVLVDRSIKTTRERDCFSHSRTLTMSRESISIYMYLMFVMFYIWRIDLFLSDSL